MDVEGRKLIFRAAQRCGSVLALATRDESREDLGDDKSWGHCVEERRMA